VHDELHMVSSISSPNSGLAAGLVEDAGTTERCSQSRCARLQVDATGPRVSHSWHRTRQVPTNSDTIGHDPQIGQHFMPGDIPKWDTNVGPEPAEIVAQRLLLRAVQYLRRHTSVELVHKAPRTHSRRTPLAHLKRANTRCGARGLPGTWNWPCSSAVLKSSNQRSGRGTGLNGQLGYNP
jgi:hypothetical protein